MIQGGNGQRPHISRFRNSGNVRSVPGEETLAGKRSRDALNSLNVLGESHDGRVLTATACPTLMPSEHNEIAGAIKSARQVSQCSSETATLPLTKKSSRGTLIRAPCAKNVKIVMPDPGPSVLGEHLLREWKQCVQQLVKFGMCHRCSSRLARQAERTRPASVASRSKILLQPIVRRCALPLSKRTQGQNLLSA